MFVSYVCSNTLKFGPDDKAPPRDKKSRKRNAQRAARARKAAMRPRDED